MPAPPIIVESSLPQVAAPPASPIYLDPGVSYKYVIPVFKETSIGFNPVSGFTASLSGRTLTLSYTGLALSADTDFTFVITCTNGDGSTQHRPVFRVKGGAVTPVDPSFFAACISGSKNLRYQTDDTAPANALPLSGILTIGTKLRACTRSHGSAVTGIDAAVLYVVAINDALGYFQVSATSGGTAITPDASATFFFAIALAINGSTNVYVQNTFNLVVDQPIALSFTDDAALPTGFSGSKFIKEIVDPYRIKISSTVGGAALTADADAIPADENVRIVVDTTGGRGFPAIDSASEATVEEEVAITPYVVTSDIDADSYAVLGLPSGLSFDAGSATVSGTPAPGLNAQTRVVLVAYLGSTASYRYWLLNKAGAENELDLVPDAVYDTATRRFYLPTGPAGRADRIEVALNDPPLIWGIEENGDPLALPATARARVHVKQAITDSADLIFGARTFSSPLQTFQLGEDWSDAGLVTLLGTKRYIDILLQFEWRMAADPAGLYRKSKPITLRLYNDLGAGTAES